MCLLTCPSCGWAFTEPGATLTSPAGKGAFTFEDDLRDTLNGAKFVRDLYEMSGDTLHKCVALLPSHPPPHPHPATCRLPPISRHPLLPGVRPHVRPEGIQRTVPSRSYH